MQLASFTLPEFTLRGYWLPQAGAMISAFPVQNAVPYCNCAVLGYSPIVRYYEPHSCRCAVYEYVQGLLAIGQSIVHPRNIPWVTTCKVSRSWWRERKSLFQLQLRLVKYLLQFLAVEDKSNYFMVTARQLKLIGRKEVYE